MVALYDGDLKSIATYEKYQRRGDGGGLVKYIFK